MAEPLKVETRKRPAVLSLEDLVIRNFDALVGVAVLVCREHADAGDAVQIALERAWRHADELREPKHIEAWLHRIVVREAIRLQQRRRGRLARWFGRPREIPADTTSDESLDFALREALNNLPVEQRVTLVLHHYAGYSVEETAGILGVPFETARSRLRIARGRMRAALGASLDET